MGRDELNLDAGLATALKSCSMSKVEHELVKYTHHDEPSDSPLQWWNRNKSKYPNLSVMANKYLYALATLDLSERAFSYGGHIN